MNGKPDDKLDSALTRLPKSIEPEHDLWPAIAANINRRRGQKHHGWSYGAAAAAVMLAAAVITWVMFGLHAPTPVNSNFARTLPRSSPAPVSAPDIRAQFAAEIAADPGLPAASRAAFVNNLRFLQDAIQRTQAAVKKYPNDVNLRSLLLDLYQQESQLMGEAQQVQIQTTVRTTL
ncbi:MAG: hypothetical protein ACYDCJ_09060 [Gammaproteobacteria bacterium]